MNPKRLLLLLVAAAAAVGFSLPASSEAGSYQSRVAGTCGYCHHAVYSYYKPIGYDRYGRASYGWVTSHHTGCRNAYRGTAYSRPSYGFSFRISPSYSSGYRSYGSSRSGFRSYGYGASGFRSYGGRGYCR